MALLNIAALSQRTGVAPDTLRKWEQRYGVLQPDRTPGGQRRYTELDVARVEWLQARLQESYRIGEAAALLAGLGDDAPRTPAKLRAALREAMERADAVELARLLDHAFSLMKLAQAIAGVVEPLLTEIGKAWAVGEVTPAEEHLVSEAVQSRLGRLLADARSGVRGCVVLACAPGERHEIGVTALAALLHADGWGVAYLGADTPAADALELAGGASARFLCVSATMREAMDALQEQLAEVDRPEGLDLVLGGTAVTKRATRRLRALEVNGSLAGTVRALRRGAR